MLSGIIFFLTGYNIKGSISIILFAISVFILLFSLYIKNKFGQMYQSLYYREELFNSLCTNIDDIQLIFKLEGYMIEYVSPNLERLYGISVKNFKKNPRTILGQIDPVIRQELYSYFTTNILTSNKVMEINFFNSKRKQMSTLVVRIYPVFNRQTVTRYVLSVSDITKERQTQQVLKEALVNAQQANEARKDFLSHMSHEIRTPLNAINGMAQIAVKSMEDRQKVENCLNKISDASKKLIDLVSNILDMNKIDSNKLILNLEQFYMDKILYDLSDFINTQAEKNLLKFSLVLNNIVHNHLVGDSLRLYQILVNCLSNSLKFTPAGGLIRLEVEEQGIYGHQTMFCFTVIDTGKGMSEEYIERLFIPFEQEDSTIAQKYGGTGLGMSITKNLVTLMSGDIHVTSEVEKGTTITIRIPFDLYDEPYQAEDLDLPEVKQTNYDFKGYRVLVVEDNEINIEVINEFLKYTGLTVDIATCGKEAVRMFEKSPPSYYKMIFMDVQMPELSGYDTAILIRACNHPDAGSICIIAMSADSYAEDVTRSLGSGMNYHIAKPIDMDGLYRIIHQIIQQ